MRAYVVYESLWGNTAAVAGAIADGIGGEARALSTAEATPDVVADADLIVAGAPTHIARLSTEKTRATAAERARQGEDLAAPNLYHPSMVSWLETLGRGNGRGAAFETRSAGWWGGGAAARISRGLGHKGYKKTAKPASFVVLGQDGPLADGELDRARDWGRSLADRT